MRTACAFFFFNGDLRRGCDFTVRFDRDSNENFTTFVVRGYLFSGEILRTRRRAKQTNHPGVARALSFLAAHILGKILAYPNCQKALLLVISVYLNVLKLSKCLKNQIWPVNAKRYDCSPAHERILYCRHNTSVKYGLRNRSLKIHKICKHLSTHKFGVEGDKIEVSNCLYLQINICLSLIYVFSRTTMINNITFFIYA